MADEKKKSKKKKEAAAEPAAEAAPAKQASTGGSKKAKRTGSNIFSMFSERQIAEFKEGFSFMDADKDGVISKADLRATYDQIGRIADDSELTSMLAEAAGPINFTTLLSLFANRMAGESDEDAVVIDAFKTFDSNGKIDSDKFRNVLMNWGDKFSAQEVDDAFEQMEIDGKGMIDTGKLIAMLTAAPAQEEGEGEAA